MVLPLPAVIAWPAAWSAGPLGPGGVGPWSALLLLPAAALGLNLLVRQLPADTLVRSLVMRSRLSLLATVLGLWLAAGSPGPVRSGVLTVGLVWTLLRCKGSLLRHAQAHPQWLPGRSSREQALLLDGINKAITLLAVLVAGLSVLRLAGVSPAVLLTASGVGAAAVGFGAKAVVENLLSGVMLYVHRPFALGDAIELPDRRLTGRVQRIGSFYTELRSDEGQPLYLPNALFAGLAVGNLSRRSSRRLEITLTLPPLPVAALQALLQGLGQQLGGAGGEGSPSWQVQLLAGVDGALQLQISGQASADPDRYGAQRQELLLQAHRWLENVRRASGGPSL